MLELAGYWLIAYLIGGIPFGYLVARSRGVNILKQGSGNIGATNVGRVLGLRYGILVFILDFTKGALPVYAARFLPVHVEGYTAEFVEQGLLEVGVGLAAFLGHLLPVYLGLRGGKGVATGAGVVSVLVPLPALLALLAWLVVVASTRYVSLASITAVLVLCICQLGATSFALDQPRNWFCILAAVLVIVKHRANIARLRTGTEHRLPDAPALSYLARIMHVVAVGLWFGSAVFFSFVVAPVTFRSFADVTSLPRDERPAWLPLSPEFAQVNPTINGPAEQGSRLAGNVVGPIFPWYFALQAVAAFVALVPALVWTRTLHTSRVHRWRTRLVFGGVIAIIVSIGLDHMVRDLRTIRNRSVDAYLLKMQNASTAPAPGPDMTATRSAFGMWHFVSLFVNFVTILIASASMCLTAFLPTNGGQAFQTDHDH